MADRRAQADAFAAAAQAFVGTPFRLHGRHSDGLDCVGLVLAALARTGRAVPQVGGYALRNRTVARWDDAFAQAGFVRAAGMPVRGDLLLLTPGPVQHHLAVALGPQRIVHAHAGLRRVVAGPFDPAQIAQLFRLSHTDKD